MQRRANRYCRDERLPCQFGLKQHSDWQNAALIYLLLRGDSISAYHTDFMSCQDCQVRETIGVVVRVITGGVCAFWGLCIIHLAYRSRSEYKNVCVHGSILEMNISFN